MSFKTPETGHRILSSTIWIPLSRLSYTIIMSQFIYLWYNIGTRRDLVRMATIDLMKEALLSLVASFLIGNLVFVFLEAPIQNILLYLTGMGKRKSSLKQDGSCTTFSSVMKKSKEKQEEGQKETKSNLLNSKLEMPPVIVRFEGC